MQKHILVYDSDVSNCLQVRRYLNQMGYEVSTAFCEVDVRVLLNTLSIDGLIIDDELHARLAPLALQSRTPLPVIVIRAINLHPLPTSPLEKGVKAYLDKPINPDLLRKKSSIHFGMAGLIEEEIAG